MLDGKDLMATGQLIDQKPDQKPAQQKEAASPEAAANSVDSSLWTYPSTVPHSMEATDPWSFDDRSVATMQNTNSIFLRGRLAAPPSFSHENHGVEFMLLPLKVCRLSGAEDTLRVIAARELVDALPPLSEDSPLAVSGEVRTFNNRSGVGNRLVISVFARVLSQEAGEDENHLDLSGVLCKPPVLRTTPLGRTICDMILATNRRYGRADYLPCIAWGSLAHRCGDMKVGDPLALKGRLQSRVYTKEIDGQIQERTAFEVSIMSLADETD